MPAYLCALQGGFKLEETAIKLTVPLSDRPAEGSVLRTTIGKNISVYFVRDHGHGYFDRDALYGTFPGIYPINAERYVFFSRAALDVLCQQPVDIILCNDWHSGLSIVFLQPLGNRYSY